MRLLFIPLAAIVLAIGCRPAPNAKITRDDVPDLAGLTDAEPDTAATAAQLGDPATLRAAAIDQAEKVRGDVLQVLDFFQRATEDEPALTGETEDGKQFGQWDAIIDDVNIRVI